MRGNAWIIKQSSENGRLGGKRQRSISLTRSRNAGSGMFWRCSPTLPAQSCISGTGTTTGPRTPMPASSACRATTCSSLWALTPLACPRRTMRSRRASTPRTPPRRTLRRWRVSCAQWVRCLTGPPRSRRAKKTTTSGRSGCSCSCTRRDLPTAKPRPSTGAPPARPCLQTSRSWTAAASAAARRSCART